MLFLKHHCLSSQHLLEIERQFVNTLYGHCSPITPNFSVLDYDRTFIYGHLLGLFAKLNIGPTLGVSSSQLLDFILEVDSEYHTLPYHTFYHAADVVTMLYYMLIDLKAAEYLTPMNIINLMIAALCHDTGHNGYSNSFQTNSQTDIVTKYHGNSVLEQLSADIAIKLLDKHGLLSRIPRSEFNPEKNSTAKDCKMAIKRIILGTDIIHHNKHKKHLMDLHEKVNGIKVNNCTHTHIPSTYSNTDRSTDNACDSMNANAHTSTNFKTQSLEISEALPGSLGGHHVQQTHRDLLNSNDQLSLCGVLMHVADISNTVRPWSIAKQWSDRVVQEFFQQGDVERAIGLPISPNMDRTQTHQPGICITFSDYVLPLFQVLALFLPSSIVFVDTMRETRKKWRQLEKNISRNPPISSDSNSQALDLTLFKHHVELSTEQSASMLQEAYILLKAS
ncbi:hypothetical protein BDF14DRAFT_1883956 [Spinellus fusiger]|nr:hypothetical protein BDF14DRAFT_1883956 [Spinellus fusiger]